MKRDESDKLIDDLLEGDISEADFLRLEAELIVSKEARKAYYDRQKLQTALELDAEAAAATDPKSPAVFAARAKGKRRIDWLMIIGVAALTLLVGVLGWRIGKDSREALVARVEPVASGFGVLVAESDANWAGENVPVKGEMVPIGSLLLESGVAQIELFSGVVFLVEGEAEFEVVSPMELSVARGGVRVQAPEQVAGFHVTTPSGEARVVGTDSLLLVSTDKTEVHAVSGELEWVSRSKPPRTVLPGRSLRWDATAEQGTDGEGLEAGLLSRLGNFDRDQTTRHANRFEAWQSFSDEMKNDERLLAYYPTNDGEERGSRQLLDESGQGIDGIVVRATPASDRWGRPFGALDFSPAGSRVRLTLPGEHHSLTLMCWVRIDSLDRWYNSLFLTDGHELYEPHWQIMDDGRLFFSVRARDEKGKPDKHIAYSPPIWSPAKSGQWQHLATVYDGKAQTTTHYLNGEAISIDQIPEDLHPEKVVIGAASIGNWSEPKYRKDAEFAVRNLNGSIDEFAVFGAALNSSEIREIYEVGRP